MKLGIVAAFMALSFVHAAFAETDGASCYAPLNQPTNIKGDNVNVRLPIASVSKLITSYWAVKEKTINYRFQTVIYLSKVDQKLYDIHIQGSRDPYFGAERLHYVISELNKRGITKVRSMTFDENFKFYWSIDDRKNNKNLASGFYLARDPVPEKVTSQLRAFSKLTEGYQETFERAAKNGVKMVEHPDFTVQSIEHLSSEDFKTAATETTSMFVVHSTPLVNLLKEMNRNSNNHAANQIFEHLENEKKFSQFLFKSLNLDMKSVVMLNGSGDRVDMVDGPRYNEATCSAMLKIMMDLHTTLLSQNSSLAQVASITGIDSDSTASHLYNTDKTEGAVAAKTGTVNPAVTLGGVASTEKGLVFFMFNIKTQGNGKSWAKGRKEIKEKLEELMDKFEGGVKLKAKSFSFISFDKQSFSEIEKEQTGTKLQ